MDTHQVALVTGATSGIGAATARALHAQGWTVYGSGRRVERLAALADEGVGPLPMDLTDDATLAAAVDRVLAETGRIDLLVNNAGYGSLGSLEETPLDEGRRQFDVNVFGAARLIQLVVPHMRDAGRGRIVNVTSGGGKAHTPLGSWYHGTKFALEAISDCLRIELAPFGIDVVVVEPGPTDTEWGGIAAHLLRETSGSGPYARLAVPLAAGYDHTGTARLTPSATVARVITTAATARRPRTRYAIGAARAAVLARRWLGDRAYDRLIVRVSGLPRARR
ncbi:oxidoreductase [Cellulomonas sp. ES6]|uniref:oxidoreductase n=1 Tax=Cellulomonas sp. ES6 TaxID=3039384 RepID=UPI0024B79620|nr:oxidoreductase [Cellulomonas sp. ES6]WHP17876.1 oxidoreductase [Cellulomonas sp. ES6]